MGHTGGMSRAIRCLSLAAALSLALVGCKKSASWGGKKLDASAVHVATDRLHLRQVKVGLEPQHQSVATVVMVDVRNDHDKDVDVTLDGKLFDAGNKPIGTLTKQSLRIPKGATRLFALVDSEAKERKAAAGASIEVEGVHEVKSASEIHISGVKVYKDKNVDRVILQAKVDNTGKASVRTLILCAFYDKDNVPLSRPFSELRLKVGESQAVQFIGPEGSVRADIYPGETFWY